MTKVLFFRLSLIYLFCFTLSASDNQSDESRQLTCVHSIINRAESSRCNLNRPMCDILNDYNSNSVLSVTPLIAAVRHSRLYFVRRLLDLGADVNHTIEIYREPQSDSDLKEIEKAMKTLQFQYTTPGVPSRWETSAFAEALIKNDHGVASFLFAKGATIGTPVMHAIIRSSPRQCEEGGSFLTNLGILLRRLKAHQAEHFDELLGAIEVIESSRAPLTPEVARDPDVLTKGCDADVSSDETSCNSNLD